MEHVAWWTQAPEPSKPKKKEDRYAESAAHGFYAGPGKKSSRDEYYGSSFAVFEHPIDVVSNTVQFSFTTKDNIPNHHPPADYLSFSAAERLINLESNPSYVICRHWLYSSHGLSICR